MPALRALARGFPDHRRVLAGPGSLAPIVELMGGAVDLVTDTAPLAPLDRALPPPDVAVNLHGRGPESHRVLLEASPRRLLAFGHPAVPESAGGPAWIDREHEVMRWCRLLEQSGVPADPDELDLAAPGDPAPPIVPGATLLHPGAATGARRWPAERFAAVGRAERAAGRPVAVTGGPAEVELARSVARAAGLSGSAVLAGRTDLRGLTAAVAAAGRMVSNDTGVAHLATALRCPSVIVFGPAPADVWAPPAWRTWHRVLWSGRSGDPHAGEPHPSLLEIGVDAVLAALAELPERTDVPAPTTRHGPAS